MHSHEFYSMNEQEFDALLENALPPQPPDDIVKETTPWRLAIDHILIGLALTNITLNFLGLSYLLPAIGHLQLLRGWRALRQENGWFRVGWYLTIPQALLFFFILVLNATVYQECFFTLSFIPWLTAIGVAVEFFTLLCLWGGFRAVRRKAGLPAQAKGAVALMVWYAAICLLGLQKVQGGLLFGGLLLLIYILLLRSLYTLSKELDEAGYAIETTRVRVSDGALVKCIAATVLIGIVCGYLFLGRPPMDWQVQDTSASQQEEIREHLLSLGFPEEVLDDLTAEDLIACKDAVRITVEVDELAMNDGREVRVTFGNHTQVHTEYDVHELKITGIGVQLPGEREHWKLIHHFLWQAEPSYRGTEAIQFWPAYREDMGWRQEGEFSGQVLYDKDGQTFVSPFYHLGKETYTAESFFGNHVTTDVFAAYTLPRSGEDCRGYVSYEILEQREGYIVDGWANFVHQEGWFQYPVKSAMEHRKTGGWFSNAPFHVGQTAIQFYPTENDLERIS